MTIGHAELTARMREAGIEHFDGREVLRLQNRAARRAHSLPPIVELPEEYLPAVIELGLHLERIRAIVGKPIRVLGWYRPVGYNASAGGKPAEGDDPGSDHLRAAGVDIRVPYHGRALHRAVVEAWLGNPRATSIGVYRWGRRHVGVQHKGGKLARQWPRGNPHRAAEHHAPARTRARGSAGFGPRGEPMSYYPPKLPPTTPGPYPLAGLDLNAPPQGA